MILEERRRERIGQMECLRWSIMSGAIGLVSGPLRTPSWRSNSQDSPSTIFGEVGAGCTSVGAERARLRSSSPRKVRHTPDHAAGDPLIPLPIPPRFPKLLKAALHVFVAE